MNKKFFLTNTKKIFTKINFFFDNDKKNFLTMTKNFLTMTKKFLAMTKRILTMTKNFSDNDKTIF